MKRVNRKKSKNIKTEDFKLIVFALVIIVVGFIFPFVAHRFIKIYKEIKNRNYHIEYSFMPNPDELVVALYRDKEPKRKRKYKETVAEFMCFDFKSDNEIKYRYVLENIHIRNEMLVGVIPGAGYFYVTGKSTAQVILPSDSSNGTLIIYTSSSGFSCFEERFETMQSKIVGEYIYIMALDFNKNCHYIIIGAEGIKTHEVLNEYYGFQLRNSNYFYFEFEIEKDIIPRKTIKFYPANLTEEKAESMETERNKLIESASENAENKGFIMQPNSYNDKYITGYLSYLKELSDRRIFMKEEKHVFFFDNSNWLSIPLGKSIIYNQTHLTGNTRQVFGMYRQGYSEKPVFFYWDIETENIEFYNSKDIFDKLPRGVYYEWISRD